MSAKMMSIENDAEVAYVGYAHERGLIGMAYIFAREPFMSGYIKAATRAAPQGVLTDAQIAAGAAILCDHGTPIGRNTAISVYDAMTKGTV